MPIIVDANTNLDSADAWALVLNGLVVNAILASTNDINNSVFNIKSPYYVAFDYIINLTIQGQHASPGWTYNPGGNTFMAPPPPIIDFSTLTQQDITGVAEGLIQCLDDSASGFLTSDQINTVFAAAIADTEAQFSPNQMALMNIIHSFILSGG